MFHKPLNMWQWKIVGNTQQCVIVLQSQRQDHKEYQNVMHTGSQSVTYANKVDCSVKYQTTEVASNKELGVTMPGQSKTRCR